MIEKLKSALLISLIGCAMVLGYLSLNLGSSANSSVVAPPVPEVNYYDYVSPRSFDYAVGGISFTKIYDVQVQQSIWGQIAAGVAEWISEAHRVREIDLGRYLTDYRAGALLLEFPDYVTASVLTAGGSSGAVRSDLRISEMLISARSVLVYDRADDRRYEILSGAPPFDLERVRSSVAGSATNRSYRRLFERFSLEGTLPDGEEYRNYKLIPYQYDYIVGSFLVEPEFDRESEVGIYVTSQKVFGSSLDFVKQLVDAKGSPVLMYGYGERSLTFEDEGVLTYKSRSNGSRSKSTLKSSLDAACGFLETLGPLPPNLFLIDVIEHSAYDFELVFAYRMNNYVVVDTGGDPIELRVRVLANQVVEAKRHVLLLGQSLNPGDWSRMYPVDQSILDYNDLLVANYLDSIGRRELLLREDFNSNDYFFRLRSAIRDIELVMVFERGRISPYWSVQIDGDCYLFNAYDGSLR